MDAQLKKLVDEKAEAHLRGVLETLTPDTLAAPDAWADFIVSTFIAGIRAGIEIADGLTKKVAEDLGLAT